MRFLSVILIIFIKLALHAQSIELPLQLQKTMIGKLAIGDSLVYYQCHVEELAQQLSTTSGQTLSTAPQKYSITEKFIVTREEGSYKAKSYVSSMIILPNRRFSGLKIREKAYWNFKKQQDTVLSERAIKLLAALENKGHEPTEYDFAITKYNTNEVIIKQRKDFKQLVIEGNYIISKLIFE